MRLIRSFLFSRANKEFLLFLFFLAISASFWLLMTLNENYEQEVANANHPLVRLFQVEKVVAHTPQTKVPLGHTKGWAVCSPEMVKEFSAAAYFFAREVSEKLGIAVGVVNSSWGGTPAESLPRWLPGIRRCIQCRVSSGSHQTD